MGSVSPFPRTLISTTGGSPIRAGGVTHTRPTRTGALSTLGNHPLVRCPNEQCQRARGPPKCGMLPPPDSLGGSRRLSCNGETRGLNTHRIRSLRPFSGGLPTALPTKQPWGHAILLSWWDAERFPERVAHQCQHGPHIFFTRHDADQLPYMSRPRRESATAMCDEPDPAATVR